MKFSVPIAFLAVLTSALAQSTAAPGYFTDTTTLPNNNTFSFGQHYAVLNLDLINGFVSGVNTTAEGQAFISSTAKWISAVHAQSPQPLSIFTRFYFSNSQRPEISPSDPFAADVTALGNVTETSPQGMLYPAFVPAPNDVVLQKTRYYAGAGNGLEEILASQKIDTVILVSSCHKGKIVTLISGIIVWSSYSWCYCQHRIQAFRP